MARLKLDLPTYFNFSTLIKVRIGDLNYGNHLSNDVYLTYMHEARMQYFESLGYSEMNLAGTSVIMGDSALVYKGECFYGDELKIEVAAAEFGSRSFDLYYRMTKVANNQLVCEAKTGMVCFDYNIRKSTNIPDDFRQKVLGQF